jgi:hypothetical protein
MHVHYIYIMMAKSGVAGYMLVHLHQIHTYNIIYTYIIQGASSLRSLTPIPSRAAYASILLTILTNCACAHRARAHPGCLCDFINRLARGIR